MTSIKIERDQLNQLITKYGGAVPRYTSYPTAPEWRSDFYKGEMQGAFENAILKANKTNNDLSLYLHIPFCESQCYYCGCNVVISPNHGIEEKYIQQLKEEISYYGDIVSKEKRVMQMAWGGGTPTFLSPEQIKDLYQHIARNFNMVETEQDTVDEMVKASKNPQEGIERFANEKEYAIEIDPRVTTVEHLKALKECGFNRLSMGIQDFNLKTQETINRIQSFEDVFDLVKEARELGFESINFDLIYGLPFQTLETFKDTVEKVKEIDPERIALFNYAHIPAIFPFQAKYILDQDLPSQKTKLDIFDMAVEELTDFGYEFIGIDHFAKPEDSLSEAQREKTLYRNFQGYTTHSGCDMLSFGISAISDVQGVYKQNPKKMNAYYTDIFAADKYKSCSEDDIERREIIKQIMCNGYAVIDTVRYAAELKMLKEFFSDGLLKWEFDYTKNFLNETEEDLNWAMDKIKKADMLIQNKRVMLEVTDLGRFFVRNIASVFDVYLRKEKGHKLFSKAL